MYVVIMISITVINNNFTYKVQLIFGILAKIYSNPVVFS
jgi:hypothetical protein